MDSMNENDIELKFKKSGITLTPIRKMIYKCIQTSVSPLSLSDIENKLETVDKSSISRALNIFRKNHLVHYFDDGTGSVKYEICHSIDHEMVDDTHAHFHCSKCGETFCLQSVSIPIVELPEGFKVKDINYIITGICKNCCKE